MDIITTREYCLTKAKTEESLPFDDQTLVLKVAGKMFAIIALDGEPCIALKCDPELAVTLRETYPAVLPGYHLNKTHWNTVLLNDTIPDATLQEWIDHSYELVKAALPKKVRETLESNE
jgi:predicted DNA-binding protein (MmcQ/YjbR family)